MSDIVIDLDQIRVLPGVLRGQASSLAGASTLPSPDTGSTTGLTRAAVDRVSSLSTAFATDLGSLADGLDKVLAVYEDTDGRATWSLSFYGEWVYQ